MGLKSMLKEQPFMTEPDSSSSSPESLIKELTDRLAQEQAKNTELTSTLSEKELKIQEMQSLLTTQQGQIASLTERASSVNKTESLNEKLSEQAAKAQALVDRKNREANAAEERAERASASARESEERKRKADQAAWEAEQQTRQAQDTTRRAQTRYKSASIALGAVAIVQAVLLSWGRGSAWSEIGQWWVLRWHNIISTGRGIGAAFRWTATLLGSWGVPGPWGYVIAAAVAAGLAVGLFFLGRAGVKALAATVGRIRRQYQDGMWKASMTAATTLTLFFICLWAYTPLQAVWPFNIFSLWLLAALIGAAAWNYTEIKRGLHHARG